MICRKFSVLAFIWWVYHQNWTKFDRVIEFYFLLRNFPKIHRFWLILAQFLLTSSLFWIFSSFYERTHQREHFCQKLLKLHYSFPRYEGGVNLPHSPPKMGVSETPPKIGLIPSIRGEVPSMEIQGEDSLCQFFRERGTLTPLHNEMIAYY